MFWLEALYTGEVTGTQNDAGLWWPHNLNTYTDFNDFVLKSNFFQYDGAIYEQQEP